MTRWRRLSLAMVLAALVVGTLADRLPVRQPLVLGGYRVLAADFHVHSSTWSDGALTPLGLVLEAGHQGLDAIAITGHQQVSDSKVARWLSARIGGPTILVGQEVVAPDHHLVAIGIEQVIDARQAVASQIDAIHAQGGVAIAAHPVRHFWPAFDAAAMARLDGAEICHPLVYGDERSQQVLEEFSARGQVAAIGSSDFHGLARLGICRTYVFAADASAAAILAAIRARRTVVYAPQGRVYGDPALIGLAASQPRLRTMATEDAPPGALDLVSRIAGLLGLAGLVAGQGTRRDR